MRARSAAVGGGVTAAAAVLGNVIVGKEALSWFRGLRAPRFQLPMPGFLSVAAAYYVIMGVVLARGIDRRDAGTIAWAVAVLAGNEAWNGLLGRRGLVAPGLSTSEPPSIQEDAGHRHRRRGRAGRRTEHGRFEAVHHSTRDRRVQSEGILVLPSCASDGAIRLGP
jgi:hypothetical protein